MDDLGIPVMGGWIDIETIICCFMSQNKIIMLLSPGLSEFQVYFASRIDDFRVCLPLPK